MQCICCLDKSQNGRSFSILTAADKKLHFELTKLELNFKNRFKICEECKKLLCSSARFIKLCIKSYEELSMINKKEVKVKLKRSSSRKNDNFVDETKDETVPSCHLDHDEDSDEEPISNLVEQLKQNGKDKSSDLIIPVTSITSQETLLETNKTTIDSKKRINKFLCTECGTSFSTSQRLQVHSFTHSGIKNWKCVNCDKVFATKFRLRAHTRTHTGERPFVCDVCSQGFAQGSALKCHKRIHTKERPFICKICSKSFSQNTTLKTHMAALHLGKTVTCDEPGCDKKFTRRSYLLIHKRDHAGERNYVCERCPNQYKQKSHLDRHVEASHLGIRHKCDVAGCSSDFSKSWSLKMHKFLHAPDNSLLPYQCQTCNSGFQRRDKLLKHQAKAHPNDKEHEKSESIKANETSSSNKSNFVVLSTTPEIYTIQNLDGSYTQVQTLELIEEN